MKRLLRFIFLSILMLTSAAFSSSSYAFLGLGGPDKEAYNKPETAQYKSLTAKIIGKWDIISLLGDADKELFGTRYSSGTLTLDGDTRNARLVMRLSPSEIAQYLPEWRDKNSDPKLVISEYVMITESPFKMSWHNVNDIGTKDRVFLILTEPKFSIEVKGEGNLDAFKQNEFVKYSAAQSAAKTASQAGATAGGGGFGGMLGGFVAQKMAKQATDTQLGKIDYFYVFDASAGNVPRFIEDNSGNWTWWKFTFKAAK